MPLTMPIVFIWSKKSAPIGMLVKSDKTYSIRPRKSDLVPFQKEIEDLTGQMRGQRGHAGITAFDQFNG